MTSKCDCARFAGAFGSAAGDFSATLSKGLDHEDVEVREATADSLGKIGTASLPFAERLAGILHPSYFDGAPSLRNISDDKIVPLPPRMIANASLRLMADAGATALAEHIYDEDSRVRATVTEALGQMKEDAVPHAVRLADKLVEVDPIIRARAAESLGELGAGAILHVTQLAALLWDSDSGVRRAAGEALQKVSEASNMNYDQLMDAVARGETYMRRLAMHEHPLAAPLEHRQRIGLHTEYSLDNSAQHELRVNERPQKAANFFVPVP